MPFAFEQNAKRFQHIALIIGNKNPAHRLTLNSRKRSESTANPEFYQSGGNDADVVEALVSSAYLFRSVLENKHRYNTIRLVTRHPNHGDDGRKNRPSRD
jgi:hypothetical protein